MYLYLIYTKCTLSEAISEYLYTGQAGSSLCYIEVTNQCFMIKRVVSPSGLCQVDTLYNILSSMSISPLHDA